MFDFLTLIQKTKELIQQAKNIDSLESIKKKYLGKSGFFNQQIRNACSLPSAIRFKKLLIINDAKKNIEQLILARKNILQNEIIDIQIKKEKIDISLPGRKQRIGGLHPITHIIDRVTMFFKNMGFSVMNGPEIEDSYYNFDSLNIPDQHPARDDQDTFWIDKVHLLRTQTSGIQIRVMKMYAPPIRIIAPGRVYRKDYDKYHTPMFHQIEGLVVDKDINFNHLKGIMYDFLHNFFDTTDRIKIRFRPSYFPFTEPSAEIDIMRNTGDWMEILGCGMVHPNVLRNVNVDSEIFSGFAFGVGIERLAMLYYGITDLRLFFENNMRFLTQFK